jgi:hypothetical protein
MKRKITITAAVFFICFEGFAGDVEQYFAQFRAGRADWVLQEKILSANSAVQLVASLQPYYTDSAANVRSQAYYMTYRKGVRSISADGSLTVGALSKGLDDESSGNSGQVLSYLQDFPAACFGAEVKSAISAALQNTRRPHYGALAMLAGYLDTGIETLAAIREDGNRPAAVRWAASLALARTGNEQALKYCVETVKKLPLGSDLVSGVLPDLIYTRQKSALDYCVELLYADSKVCRSANPEFSEKITCAYFIIELLAPVIEDFPITADRSVGQESDDYPATLKQVREWFSQHPNYRIKNDTY